jgi:cofilin
MAIERDHQEDHALRGGDDLEDDFIDEEEPKPTKNKNAKLPSSDSGNGEKNASAKAKGKQAPKVVKFFG